MQVAQVIPSLRTPRHVAAFDYAVPSGMTVTPGEMVRIPFRSSSLVGVVASVSEIPQTDRPLKSIQEIISCVRFSSATLRLLGALAERSGSSPASVLHAWIGSLPKRIPTDAFVAHQATLLGASETRLLKNRWHGPGGIIETATTALDDEKRVLILTPWAESAMALAAILNVPLFTGTVAAGARFKAWSGFIRGDHRLVVATRLGAWLAAEADIVIIDEPENDDHKQDELAPRYDARWLTDQARTTGTSVIQIGLTPRLNAQPPAAPDLSCDVTGVDVHPADWSDIAGLQNRAYNALEEARDAGRPITIIHPIHGDRARLRCADCGWTAVCARCGAGPSVQGNRLACHRCGWKSDNVLTCGACGGTNLSKSRPGRDTLQRDLTARGLTDVRVVSLGEWHMTTASHATTQSPRPLVILTDLSLLAGGTEDIRRRERLLIAFRRLVDICHTMDAELLVQSSAELLAESRLWLTADGCQTTLVREYAERTTFKLPPAYRMTKLIIRGSLSTAEGVRHQLQDTDPSLSVLGPYSVVNLPGSRMPRAVLQLIFPLETPDKAIWDRLHPILTPDILVDLDPVAFFE